MALDLFVLFLSLTLCTSLRLGTWPGNILWEFVFGWSPCQGSDMNETIGLERAWSSTIPSLSFLIRNCLYCMHPSGFFGRSFASMLLNHPEMLAAVCKGTTLMGFLLYRRLSRRTRSSSVRVRASLRRRCSAILLKSWSISSWVWPGSRQFISTYSNNKNYLIGTISTS